MIRPSKKAIKYTRGEIEGWTCRRTIAIPQETIIKHLNDIVRGWTGYFYYGNCSRDLRKLKGFLDERARTILRRKHGRKIGGYRAYLTTTSMSCWGFTRYRQLHIGRKLRKPLEEDEWKAVFGKTERMIW